MNSNNKKITGAAIIVMSSLVVSRITGYIRTILINNLLTAAQSDSLLAAFRTTDLMYNLLIGGAISAALIPVLSGYLARGEEEDGWKAVGTFINVIFLCMLAVCTLGVIFAPWVVSMTASGLEGEVRETTIYLTRILFPSVGFMMLAGMTNGVLNSYQRFAAAAYGPSLYNLGTALSILILSRLGVRFVAYGVLASAVMYFIIQISFALPNFKYYKPWLLLRHSGFRKLFGLAIPSLAASAVVQINILISLNFISLFKHEGSITAYYNANDIWQLPYGIFAMGLGTALLPTLSEKLALRQVEEFKNILNGAFKTILYLIIPSAIAFAVIPKPVISVVYKWSSNIDGERIITAGSILLLFTAAMLAQSMLAILNRAFYANNDTKTPLYAGTAAIILNFIFCTVFQRAGLGPAGMSLAYSIQSLVNMTVMMYILLKRMNGMQWRGLLKYSFKLLEAAAVMGLVIFTLDRLIPVDFTQTYSMHSKIIEISVLAAEIVVGAGIYFGCTMLLKVEEAVAFKNRYLGRFAGILKK